MTQVLQDAMTLMSGLRLTRRSRWPRPGHVDRCAMPSAAMGRTLIRMARRS